MTWADRDFLVYENWAENQPNGRDIGENCIEMSNGNGEWNDDDCNDSANFVCKMPTSKSYYFITLRRRRVKI